MSLQKAVVPCRDNDRSEFYRFRSCTKHETYFLLLICHFWNLFVCLLGHFRNRHMRSPAPSVSLCCEFSLNNKGNAINGFEVIDDQLPILKRDLEFFFQ